MENDEEKPGYIILNKEHHFEGIEKSVLLYLNQPSLIFQKDNPLFFMVPVGILGLHEVNAFVNM